MNHALRSEPSPAPADPALPPLSSTPPGHGLRPCWMLEPGMHFLNHGSFGATPRPVLAAQDAWRRRLEAQPVRFMLSELPGLLRAAADRLGAFLGTSGERIAFVENATDGVNAVLRSLDWHAGDEIVLAGHAYPAIRNTVRWVAQRHGLVVREARVPFPLASAESIRAAYRTALGARTRLAIVDQVFSPLAVLAPVAAIVADCHAQGVPVLVDAAHAPGMLAMKLDEVGAEWTVGNAHKWLLAPKGCAFLHAAAAAPPVHPTVISNFHGQGFATEFDWQGTRDCSAWLAVGAALDFVESFGAERYRRCLAALAGEAALLLSTRWNVALPAPPECLAAMVTLPLPGALQIAGGDSDIAAAEARRLHDRLWSEFRIEVPVLAFNGRLWVRISAQIYNDLSDYEALAAAVETLAREAAADRA